MENTETNNVAFNEAEGNVTPQPENQNVAATPETTTGQPKNSNLLKWIIILIVATVAAVVLAKVFLKSDDYEDYYDYEYGDEPSDGFVYYTDRSSNIINPSTRETIVEDIDWCHYSSNNDDPIVLFAKNGKRGFCNIVTNEVIVEPTTYTKAWVFSEGLAAVEKNGFIGFVNTNGDVAIDFKYSYRGNPLSEFVFHHGHCVVADSSNNIGVIDQRGRWVVKPIYDNIELAKDYAIVYKDGDFKKQINFQGEVLQDGIIDYINNLYYEIEYKDLETGEPQVGSAKNNDFYEYRVGGYSGLLDSKGGIITPPIYTDITGLTPTLFKATLQDWNSIVIIDQKGNVLSKVTK